MGREAPEEEHEVLLGIDDRTRRSTATATAAQDPQLDPTKDGGVLATFRRRLRNEDPPDRSGEQASDGDEPRAAKNSETRRLPLAVDTLVPQSDSHRQHRHANNTCSCNDDFTRRVLKALKTTLVIATVIALGLVVAAFEGLWDWREWFPYKGELYDPVRACRAVHAGPEWPCGSPWSAPCFNRSRCATDDSNRGALSVYVHDDHCSMRRSSDILAGDTGKPVHDSSIELAEALRTAAKERGQLAETPAQACVVIYGAPTKTECVSRTRTWRGGQNHLILDLHDQSRLRHATLDKKAMFGESNMRPCYFRYGYDIALPLAPRTVFPTLRDTPAQGRKYFATFKGSLYLSGNGHAEREAVRNIGQTSQDTDVVVVEKCQTRHNEHKLSWNVELCQSLQQEYDTFDYKDLMNTTFALLPGGRSPATYRLGEALSAGTIPVFIIKDYVKPFPGRIPWRKFSLCFPTEEAEHVLEFLRAIPMEKVIEMQAIALDVYDEFFGVGAERIARVTLDILGERLSL